MSAADAKARGSYIPAPMNAVASTSTRAPGCASAVIATSVEHGMRPEKYSPRALPKACDHARQDEMVPDLQAIAVNIARGLRDRCNRNFRDLVQSRFPLFYSAAMACFFSAWA